MGKIKQESKKAFKGRLTAVVVVLAIFLGAAFVPLAAFSVRSLSGFGWEVGSGIQRVAIDTSSVTVGGGGAYTYDPDGYPYAESVRQGLGYVWNAHGYEYARTLFEVGGTYMVDGFGNPTSNPVDSYPTSGTITRTVDGVTYECVYDLLVYRIDARAISQTSARKYDGGWAYPVWVTDAAIGNDLTGLRGKYFANNIYDVQLTVRFQLDPWDYRDADAVWGGIVDAYIIDTDTAILSPKTYGEDGSSSSIRDSPALVEANEGITWVNVDGEKPSGNWVDLAPDTDFSHIVDITVSGRMKQGADLKVGLLGDVIAMDIADVQIDWDIAVEVLVIHGWIPEEGLEQDLPTHNKEQEVHPADIWERLDSLFSGFGGYINFIILIIAIGLVVIIAAFVFSISAKGIAHLRKKS